VLDGLDVDEAERLRLVNNTRVGVVGGQQVVPGIRQTQGPRTIFPALSAVMWLSDTTREWDTFDRDGERPEWIDEDEWNACATSGGDDWTGDFFDGARDWLATFDGVDCNDVRADWDKARNPDYVPIGVAASAGGFPASFSACGYSTPSCSSFSADIFWSDTMRTNGTITRKEGWVLRVTRTAGTENGFSFRVKTLSSTGALGSEFIYYGGMSNTDSGAAGSVHSRNASCTTVPNSVQCIVIALGNAASGTWSTTLGLTITRAETSGAISSAPYTPTQLPYVSPVDGTFTGGALPRQQLLTTVWTETGGPYMCRTESFVETAPTIPRPCEPTVPPDEVETERTVEVVPETDPGYVPKSDPARRVSTTEVPDVVRDWEREYDPDSGTLLLLDLELEGVGSCFDNPDECAEWYTDPNKADRMRCTYGGADVALSECEKYARLFKSGAIAAGTPYPGPTGAPNGNPTAPTGAPGGGIAPGANPSDPNATRNCWAGMVSWNPIDWVFTPVKCALEWAFVPRESATKGNVNRMRDAFNQTTLRQITATMDTVMMAIPEEGGCGGIPLDIEWAGVSVHQNLLDGCSPELAGAAGITKSILTAGAITAAVLACSRYLAVIFGFVGYGQVLEMRAAEKAERQASRGNS
jgi:hypothetical protein